MAGSYSHCCVPKYDEDDQLSYEDHDIVKVVPHKFTFDSIDNMGDAHEACEEMHWMIQHLAEQLSWEGINGSKAIERANKDWYKHERGEI